MDAWIPSLPPAVLHYLITLIGALIIYVFSAAKGPARANNFLKAMFPNRSDVFYNRTDFLLVTGIGSIIGFIFFVPDSAIHALSAGLSWSGALGVLTSKHG